MQEIPPSSRPHKKFTLDEDEGRFELDKSSLLAKVCDKIGIDIIKDKELVQDVKYQIDTNPETGQYAVEHLSYDQGVNTFAVKIQFEVKLANEMQKQNVEETIEVKVKGEDIAKVDKNPHMDQNIAAEAILAAKVQAFAIKAALSPQNPYHAKMRNKIEFLSKNRFKATFEKPKYLFDDHTASFGDLKIPLSTIDKSCKTAKRLDSAPFDISKMDDAWLVFMNSFILGMFGVSQSDLDRTFPPKTLKKKIEITHQSEAGQKRAKIENFSIKKPEDKETFRNLIQEDNFDVKTYRKKVEAEIEYALEEWNTHTSFELTQRDLNEYQRIYAERNETPIRPDKKRKAWKERTKILPRLHKRIRAQKNDLSHLEKLTEKMSPLKEDLDRLLEQYDVLTENLSGKEKSKAQDFISHCRNRLSVVTTVQADMARLASPSTSEEEQSPLEKTFFGVAKFLASDELQDISKPSPQAMELDEDVDTPKPTPKIMELDEDEDIPKKRPNIEDVD